MSQVLYIHLFNTHTPVTSPYFYYSTMKDCSANFLLHSTIYHSGLMLGIVLILIAIHFERLILFYINMHWAHLSKLTVIIYNLKEKNTDMTHEAVKLHIRNVTKVLFPGRIWSGNELFTIIEGHMRVKLKDKFCE